MPSHPTGPPAQSQPTEPIEVAKFWKSRQRNEHVRVVLSNFKGFNVIDVRIFHTGPDGIDRPTPKGISLVVSKLPEFAAALNKALKRAQTLGLLDQEQHDVRS